MKAAKRTPQTWQMNPDKLDADEVQFWANGVMVSGMMPKTRAAEMIRAGRAFVMTGQAVGALDSNGYCNS